MIYFEFFLLKHWKRKTNNNKKNKNKLKENSKKRKEKIKIKLKTRVCISFWFFVKFSFFLGEKCSALKSLHEKKRTPLLIQTLLYYSLGDYFRYILGIFFLIFLFIYKFFISFHCSFKCYIKFLMQKIGNFLKIVFFFNFFNFLLLLAIHFLLIF